MKRSTWQDRPKRKLIQMGGYYFSGNWRDCTWAWDKVTIISEIGIKYSSLIAQFSINFVDGRSKVIELPLAPKFKEQLGWFGRIKRVPYSAQDYFDDQESMEVITTAHRECTDQFNSWFRSRLV